MDPKVGQGSKCVEAPSASPPPPVNAAPLREGYTTVALVLQRCIACRVPTDAQVEILPRATFFVACVKALGTSAGVGRGCAFGLWVWAWVGFWGGQTHGSKVDTWGSNVGVKSWHWESKVGTWGSQAGV